MKSQRPNRKPWGGIVLIIIGVLFLLDNLDIIPYYLPNFLFQWESIFVIIGISMLATGRRAGLVFLLIGGFFLIPEIFYIPGFYFDDWWPMILVIIGISVLLRGRHKGAPKPGEVDENFLDEMSVFGGTKKVVTAQELRGGKLTFVFGGSEINLTNANLAPGENVIDVFVLFGGTTIVVPPEWKVRIDATAIFGGFSDERNPVVTDGDDTKELVIKGFIMFGGGDIKSQ